MSQIVDLNSTSSTDAFINYLLNDINLDNPSGSERLINNTFGTWLNSDGTLSISSGIVDLTYDESSIFVNFSLNAKFIDKDTNLTFNTAFNGSIGVEFDAWSYLASNKDLISVYGANKTAAIKHYVNHGISESRYFDTFDDLQYLASYGDLINAFGSDITAATKHYVEYGYKEGRSADIFDEWGYLASNVDLIKAFGTDTKEAIKHYIVFGNSEGRFTNLFDAQSYLNKHADLRNAFGNDQELATKHYVEYGFSEGRIF